MNTGVEAGESAIKLARRWGYVKKMFSPTKLLSFLPRETSGEEL